MYSNPYGSRDGACKCSEVHGETRREEASGRIKLQIGICEWRDGAVVVLLLREHRIRIDILWELDSVLALFTEHNDSVHSSSSLIRHDNFRIPYILLNIKQ